MKKESKYFLIIIILLFLILLTVFKYKIYPNIKVNVGKFNSVNLSDDVYKKDYLDEEYYSKSVPKYFHTIAFEIANKQNEKISIKFEIKDDKFLYASINNDTKKISDTSFLSIFWHQESYNLDAKIYLLSEDNNLYLIENIGQNLNKIDVKKIDTQKNVKNFTTAKIRNDIYLTTDVFFLLYDDGNFYNLNNNLRYDKDIVSLYDLFYVMPNNEIVTKDNKVLLINNEKVKIKYCFDVFTDNFVPKYSKIIITSDDKLLYYDFNKKEYYYLNTNVKELSYKESIPYVKSNLKIWFDNGKNVEITAACNQYFCINI